VLRLVRGLVLRLVLGCRSAGALRLVLLTRRL
jgi:hypothetical protein